MLRCYHVCHTCLPACLVLALSRDGTMARVMEVQAESGITMLYNAFWNWPFASPCGVYNAIGFDRLHVLKGLVEKCVATLNGLIKEDTPEGVNPMGYLATKQAKIDFRIANAPQFLGDDVYMPTLVGGFYGRNKVCVSL